MKPATNRKRYIYIHIYIYIYIYIRLLPHLTARNEQNQQLRQHFMPSKEADESHQTHVRTAESRKGRCNAAVRRLACSVSFLVFSRVVLQSHCFFPSLRYSIQFHTFNSKVLGNCGSVAVASFLFVNLALESKILQTHACLLKRDRRFTAMFTWAVTLFYSDPDVSSRMCQSRGPV
jgi:hypothetical protein